MTHESSGKIARFRCKTHNAGPFGIDEANPRTKQKILDFHKDLNCEIEYLTDEQANKFLQPKHDSLQETVDLVTNAALQDEQKSRIISMSSDYYQKRIHEELKQLEQTVNVHFSGKYHIIEACLSVKAQQKVEGITQVFTLVLIGQPSSYKSTILEIISSLPDCYVSDSFTPKSFVSHSANTKKEQLSQVDLLPRIRYKTLITPELAPLFSGNPDQLVEYFGILTRILDGRGYKSDSGVHGQRGYAGDYSFMWLGAVVDIPHRVWKVLGNLGPKMYFLRLPYDQRTGKDKKEAIKQSILANDYNFKLKTCKNAIQSYWNLIEYKLKEDEKIKWNIERDDKETFGKIIDLAQTLAKLRASIPTWHTRESDSAGSNYNFEMPVIEDPQRASSALYNLARGHAVLYGRNYIVKDDLGVVISVALSSASRERVELFKLLLERGGKITSSEFQEYAHVSKPTALKEMQLLSLIGLVDKYEAESETKPIFTIKLKDDFGWFLSDEFKQYWTEFNSNLAPQMSLLSYGEENKEKNQMSKNTAIDKFLEPKNSDGKGSMNENSNEVVSNVPA